MKFICDKSQLNKAVNNVQRAVATRSTIEALEGILIKAEGDIIAFTGYNSELGILCEINCPVKEDGAVVADARLFGEVLRKMPGGSIEIDVDDKCNITIKSGNTIITISGKSAKEYPSLPTLNDETFTDMTIDQKTLKSMIQQTVYAASTTDSRPVHTGVLFDIDEDTLHLVAVDGFRLAIREEKLPCGRENSFVVPAKTLNDLIRMLEEEENASINIRATLRHIVFETEGLTVVSRLLEGEFLNYKAAVPQNHTTEVIVNVNDFKSSLDRVTPLITDRMKSPVRCIFADNRITLHCNAQQGGMQDWLDCSHKGDDIEIGFNNSYMMEALSHTECDEVLIQMESPLRPMVIKPTSGDSFTFLVLPVRLKS